MSMNYSEMANAMYNAFIPESVERTMSKSDKKKTRDGLNDLCRCIVNEIKDAVATISAQQFVTNVTASASTTITDAQGQPSQELTASTHVTLSVTKNNVTNLPVS